MNNEMKEHLSKKRKEWLLNNPDKHPWRKKNKFVSQPCEQLKLFFKSINVQFEEEVLISDKANYSVDMLFPGKNLILEINGNQHYNKDGTLKEYYQNRHNFIKSLGWNIIEIHYTLAYNHKLCLDIINNVHECSEILPFYYREKKYKKYIHGTRQDYNKAKKINNDFKNKNIVDEIRQNKTIQFNKFGWVNEVSKIIGITPQRVSHWMKRNMPDFYESMCYKRKQHKK